MNGSWIKVFRFTFRSAAGSKGYLCATLIVSLVLAAVIPAAMLMANGMSSDDDGSAITRAVAVGAEDIGFISEYAGIAAEYADDMDKAIDMCAGDAGAVIILFEDNSVTALTPEASEVSISEASDLAAFIAAYYPVSNIEFTEELAAEMAVPSATATQPETDEDDGSAMVSEIIGMIVPYVVVMLMYFMVLIYGQSVANSAIMEKTSKLMDMFLVSVRPSQMMLGKILATSAAGLMQALAWIFSAVGGCALGRALVLNADPDSTLAILGIFEGIGGMASMFEPAALIVSALMIIAGFALYCALAGFGGALASKPEELGSTNYLFTMALVISFFACLFTGDEPGMISASPVLAYIPFTAVLAVPGRLLTGGMSAISGMVSVAVTAISAVAVMLLAGKAYAATAFYRGKPMNPVKLIKSFIGK